MVVKLLDSLTVCIEITCKRHRNFQLKSRRFLNKRHYCTKKDEDIDVKNLLDSASPLRSTVKNNNFWATSPYPEGTTFRNGNLETEPGTPNLEDPSTNLSESVILFPGQGNQYVGMAKNLMKYPVASEMFKTANDILGYNLLKICLEGPEHVLNDTKYCQPATFVCSLALLEKLKHERPWAISNCVATCGYSLGEMTALVFAGCVSFEKGLNLVKKRCEAMAECCKKVRGGMLTVLTGPQSTLNTALSEAVEHCTSKGIENAKCVIASYLFPNCKVIAGNIEAIEFIEKNSKKYGIRRHSRLAVSGAFHTDLMKDAAEPLKNALKKADLRRPVVKLLSNVSGKPYLNTKQIEVTLPKQIYKPVKWEQIMQYLLSPPRGQPLPFLYECGPGDSLTVLAKKTNATILQQTFAVQL